MKVAVIGCGIVGASVALRLSEREEAQVAIIDGNYPGSGTTSVSFAWANSNSKPPHEYFALNFEGMREYRNLALRYNIDECLVPGGNLMFSKHAADMEDRVKRLNGWGYRAELWDRARVAEELEPNVISENSSVVGYFPEEFGILGTKLTQRLTRAAIDNGAVAYFGSFVQAIDQLSTGGYDVLLDDGSTVTVDVVVNAAGPQADKVSGFLGGPLPLAPTWGLTARINSGGDPIRRIIQTDQLEVRPDGSGHIRVHSPSVDEELMRGRVPRGLSRGATPKVDRAHLVDVLVSRVQELIPALSDRRATESYVGVRPIPKDGYPSVGPVDGLPGYFEAVTHSGITLGPLFGRLMTDVIIDEKLSPLIEPFSPDRLPRG